MPWKLVAPRKGKTKNWYIRGTYLGIRVDDSTETADRKAAGRILKTWREQAERGEFSRKRAVKPPEATFLTAAIAYMQAGGERRFVGPILKIIGAKPLADITSITIDAVADQLYPDGPASTKNRQVYTPISAILKRAGVEKSIKRPVGWKGNKRTFWLPPEPTFKLFASATEVDAELGILCVMLNYTGMRISEPLTELDCERVELERSFAYIGDTKNGNPRPLYLPPIVVAALANHPRGMNRKGPVFRFSDGHELRDLFKEACDKAGIVLPKGTAFHVFRHNYATWMTRYAGLSTRDLVGTGAWDDEESVVRYTHTEASEEARQAINLPTPGAVIKRESKFG